MKAVISRARKQLLPCEVFDLISGTSTGGIIAILLGRLGLDCPTAIKVYKDLVIAVCGSDEGTFWKSILTSIDVGLNAEAYEAKVAQIVKTYAGLEDMTMARAGVNLIDHKDTKTFVTVTSDAPTYNNRVHCIRTYSTRFQTSPVGHQWLIREAMRGTVASPVFMSPLFISKFGFRDSGFSGFNNPTGLALHEFDELWPNEKPGILISIGTDFLSLAPRPPRREWGVTDQYAQRYAMQVIEKLPSPAEPSETMKMDALNVVKQFVTLAVDTEIVHSEISSKIPPKDVYYRLNLPLDIANTDLVDIFHADQVERRVKTWLREDGQNRDYIAGIASKLVEPNVEPLTVQQARFVKPPAAPPDTNPGYNPQLDEQRPDTMPGYLRNYHVFFVVDDSSSMQKGSRWSEARDALLEIADHALQQDSDEIDMRFLNSPLKHRIKGAHTVRTIFDQVQPKGWTPMGAALDEVLKDHMTELEKTVNTPQYYKLKPLDIIVLTDGIPSDDPHKVLVDAVARMRAAKHHPNSIGVQIVQIDKDDQAVGMLKKLMDGVGNMVDTVPYDGVLTPARLERILLGGLHPTVRAMFPV